MLTFITYLLMRGFCMETYPLGQADFLFFLLTFNITIFIVAVVIIILLIFIIILIVFIFIPTILTAVLPLHHWDKLATARKTYAHLLCTLLISTTLYMIDVVFVDFFFFFFF